MNTPKSLDPQDTLVKIIFMLTGFFGFFLIILITSDRSIGITQDSAGYLAGARNIIDHKGLILLYDSLGNPLITWVPWRDNEVLHLFPWPPFFPLILSILGFMKLDLVQAGRFLNAALFGANVFLITFIIKKYLKSIFLMILAAIILLTSRNLISIHSNLWSEPLFIFLSLLGFVFLFYFLENTKILFLLVSSSFFSLAFFTRTIGVILIAVIAIAILLYSDLKIRDKLIYSFISILIIILPFSIWTLYNKLVYGISTLEFIFHPLPLKYSANILNTISLWVMPDKTPSKIRIILISILIIAVTSISSYIALKNKKRHIDKDYRLNSKIIGIFLFFILFYFIALYIARYFFDAQISLGDSRILILLLISIFIVFLFFLKRLLDFYSNRENIKILIYVFCGFLIATSFFNTNIFALYRTGQKYTHKNWYYSETIKELKEFQQIKNPIYTNEPAAVYLFLGRGSVLLPIKHNTHTDRTNPNYQRDLYEIKEEIKEKDGILVFFDSGWGDFPKENEINLDYGFYLYKDTSDGAIYRVKK